MAQGALTRIATAGKDSGRASRGLGERLWRTAQTPRAQALAVLGGLGLVYLTVNLRWVELITQDGALRTYLAQPFLWTCLIAAVLLLSWKGARHLQIKATLVPMAGLTGLFQLAALVLAGLFVGFGFSPYTHRFPAVLVNVAYFASALVAVELVRAYLLAAWRPRRPALAVVSLGALFASLSVPLAQVTSLQSGEAAVHLLGLRALPSLGEHMLATYMALMGGPLAALAYRGIVQAFEWLSPALPSLPWALSGILGLLIPYLGFLAFQSVAAPGTFQGRTQAKKADSPHAWLVLSFISVGIIWFSLGLFPHHPLVVGGESMSPSMKQGDLAILRPVDPGEIAVGDVIQYRLAGSSILHRVIEVGETASQAPLFVTKGDANTTVDPNPVYPDQVMGKVAFAIPKIGWLGVMAGKAFAFIGGLF